MKNKNKLNKKQENKNPLSKLALSKARAIAPKYCEQCGTAYKDEDFHLVQEQPGSLTFHLKCHKCKNTYILNVMAPAPHLLASQKSKILLDITDKDELDKFAGKPAVSIDEALDVFNELQQHSIKDILENKK